MPVKKNNKMLHILTLYFLVIGIVPVLNPSLLWIMPVGTFFIQLYIFLRADAFSGYEKGSPRWKTYRFLIFFSMCFLLGIYYLLYQTNTNQISTDKQSSTLIFIFILVFGNYAPKIPFNRNLGIRLPWTLKSEDTWRYAHRIAGYTSIPCAFLYLFSSLLNYKNIAGIIFLIWILIPALLSYHYSIKRKDIL